MENIIFLYLILLEWIKDPFQRLFPQPHKKSPHPLPNQ